jgi:hypothetical protein
MVDLMKNGRVSRLVMVLMLVGVAHSGAFAFGTEATAPDADEVEEARYEVSGRTVTPDGGALPGVIVALSGQGSDVSTVSDAEGAFSFTAVQPGDYAVELKASGRKKVKVKVTVSDADLDMGTITLE